MSEDTTQCTLCALNVIVSIFLFLLILPTSGVSIASFVIAGKYWHDSCSNTFMDLSTWLVINASFSVGYVFGGLLLAYLLYKLGTQSFFFYFLFGTCLFGIFKLIWNIIGSVIFFHGSMACKSLALPLWNMGLAVLIIQWLIFAVIILMLITRWLSN